MAGSRRNPALELRWCGFVDRFLPAQQAIHEVTRNTTNKGYPIFDTVSTALGPVLLFAGPEIPSLEWLQRKWLLRIEVVDSAEQ